MIQRLAKLLGIQVVHLKDLAPVVIDTPRLRLRMFRPFDDWPRYREYNRDPEVTRHLAPRAANDEQLRASLKAYAAMTQVLPGHVYLGIQERDDGRLLGEAHLLPEKASAERAYLGFVLHRDAWGRGFATEAARAMVHHAFSALSYREVWAGCTRENAASQRVLEKIGMSPTAKTITFPGEPARAETLAFRITAPSA